jgi:hypothetical protein
MAWHGKAWQGGAWLGRAGILQRTFIMSSDHNREHTALVRDIMDAVRQSGLAAIWQNQMGFDDRTKRPYGLGRGSPDLIGYSLSASTLGPGIFLGIEVKTGSGRASMEQQAWHRAATEAQCIVFVARSIKEVLERIR